MSMTHDTARYYVRFRVRRSKLWVYLTEDFTGSVLPNRAAKFGKTEARIIVDDARASDDKMEWEYKPIPRYP